LPLTGLALDARHSMLDSLALDAWRSLGCSALAARQSELAEAATLGASAISADNHEAQITAKPK
jgi:hypothetical protein